MLVDEHEMGDVPIHPQGPEMSVLSATALNPPEYDVVEVSHNGYAFMDQPVFHMRRVIF